MALLTDDNAVLAQKAGAYYSKINAMMHWQDEKGVATMCKIMEDMRNEAAREAAQKAEQNKAKKNSGSFNKAR